MDNQGPISQRANFKSIVVAIVKCDVTIQITSIVLTICLAINSIALKKSGPGL